MQSVQSSYTGGSTVTQGIAVASTSNFITVGAFAGTSTQFPDKRIQDIFTLFGRDAENNICKSDPKTLGDICLKITYSKSKLGGYGWIVPAILTGTVAWWCGMPVQNWQQELELQVEIKNPSGQVVERYEASGKAKVNIGAYFGYAKTDAPYIGQSSTGRKANIEAYKMAMAEIKGDIERDHDKISKELGQ